MKNHRRLKIVLGSVVSTLAILIPLVALLLQIFRGDEIVQVPLPKSNPIASASVNLQIRDKLEDIRREQKADGVWVSEYFRTPTGNARGFDPGGSRVVNHINTKTIVPTNFRKVLTTGKRRQFFAPLTDPNSEIANLNENLERNGFWLVPHSSDFEYVFPEVTEWLGPSFYAIAGYDLNDRMVICLWVGFFDVQTDLTEADLRRSNNDVREIVSLILS